MLRVWRMSGDELAAIPVEEGFSIAGLETLNPKPSSPYIEPHEDLHTTRIIYDSVTHRLFEFSEYYDGLFTSHVD